MSDVFQLRLNNFIHFIRHVPASILQHPRNHKNHHAASNRNLPHWNTPARCNRQRINPIYTLILIVAFPSSFLGLLPEIFGYNTNLLSFLLLQDLQCFIIGISAKIFVQHLPEDRFLRRRCHKQSHGRPELQIIRISHHLRRIRRRKQQQR